MIGYFKYYPCEAPLIHKIAAYPCYNLGMRRTVLCFNTSLAQPLKTHPGAQLGYCIY